MNKNKKLISLVAAIAMIFSLFSSFTIVNAAGAGLTLSTPEVSEDGLTMTLDVNYENITSGFQDGKFELSMPEEVTNVTSSVGSTYQYKNGKFTWSHSFGGSSTAEESGVLTTLTITLSSGLASATEIGFVGETYIYANDGTEFDMGKETLAGTGTTLPADPNAPTPKPTTDATPAPVATETPDDKPEIDEPVTATVGYTLSTPEVSEDGLTITLDVNYVGITSGFQDGKFELSMPAEVTDVTSSVGSTYQYKNGKFTWSHSFGGSSTTDESGVLTTLTIKLSTPLAYDNQIKVVDENYIYANDGTGFELGKTEGFVASNVIVPAFGEVEEPTEAGSIDMNKAITTTVTDTPAADGTSQYFIIAKVMKGENEAVYGTDYVAEYNGTKLTEAQYSNLINGHFKAENVTELGVTSMQDVIDNVKYVVYDKTVKVDAKLVETATGEIQNGDDGEVSIGGGSSTPKPTAGPSLTVSPTSKSMAYNTIMTVTSTVKNPVEGGALTYTIKNPSETKIVLEKLGDATYDAATGKGTARFASLEASGTATITVAYVDAAGETITSKDIKVTVSKSTTGSSTGSSDDDDDTSSSGIIAPPFGGTPTPAPGYKPNFQDLDSVPWAVEAINGLAARGMVKGRSETVFDPNANITRAEYCQMLVNAINAGNAAAESTYTDVPSDAWYYNAVSVASRLGIVNGLGDGNFGPNELITRQDMAVMTYRAAQSKQINLDPVNDQITFEDSNDIASYAFEAVMTLQKAGIINGMTETTFELLSNATRAQSAKILYETFVK